MCIPAARSCSSRPDARCAGSRPPAAQRASTDWPQWRGANRDGAATFTAPATWPETLKLKWKVEVGTGYAAPITVGDRVFAFSRQGEDEVMRALDAATGKTCGKRNTTPSYSAEPGGHPHARHRTQVHADLRRRPPLHARHERHRDGVRCGERQAALAEAAAADRTAVSHGDVAAGRSRPRDRARRRPQFRRADRVRRAHRRRQVELERRWPGLWLADRGGARRHAPGHHHDAGQPGRGLRRDRRAAVEAALHRALDAQRRDADRSQPDGDRVGPRHAGDRLPRDEQGRPVDLGRRVDQQRRHHGHEHRRRDRQQPVRILAAQQRPVLRDRCEHRPDAVAVRAAHRRERRRGARRQPVVRARYRSQALGRARQPEADRGAEALHRRPERDLGAAGAVGPARVHQGPELDLALDAQLGSVGSEAGKHVTAVAAYLITTLAGCRPRKVDPERRAVSCRPRRRNGTRTEVDRERSESRAVEHFRRVRARLHRPSRLPRSRRQIRGRRPDRGRHPRIDESEVRRGPVGAERRQADQDRVGRDRFAQGLRQDQGLRGQACQRRPASCRPCW